jgi:hypothetical protein
LVNDCGVAEKTRLNQECMSKIIVAISLILIGCRSYGQSNDSVFQVSNYFLVRTDSSSLGLDRKFYVYRYDPLRRMVENFFYDGKILGRAFYYKGKLEGTVETFGVEGRPLGIDSFHNGVRISSKSFRYGDSGAMFFFHGKLRPLKDGDVDSLFKKH